MLVGPTGAGKTSCAAKLAAIALSEGDDAIMITTDVGRAGALEQFATYSEKLNIECYAAETPEEISTIMREARPQGAVILDTPGISPYDAGDLAALKSFQTAIGAEPVLVLPASGDVGEYTDWPMPSAPSVCARVSLPNSMPHAASVPGSAPRLKAI